MSSFSNRENDSIILRLEKYGRFQKLALYLGGGLGGLALFGNVASGAFDIAPQWVRGAFIAAALITGLAIGYSYQRFQWAETDLRRRKRATGEKLSCPITKISDHKWPRSAHFVHNVSPFLLATTASFLLTATIWPNRTTSEPWGYGFLHWLLVILIILNVCLLAFNTMKAGKSTRAKLTVFSIVESANNWNIVNVGTEVAMDVTVLVGGAEKYISQLEPGQHEEICGSADQGGPIAVRWSARVPLWLGRAHGVGKVVT